MRTSSNHASAARDVAPGTLNQFQLFALGVDFDPDANLASTPLTFDGVWRRGERGHDRPKLNGVFKLLGDGSKVPFNEQQSIAFEYLSANRDALKDLADHPGVTTFVLGLQYNIEPGRSWLGFCISPRTRLLRLALDIGISPAFYVMLDQGRDWEGSTGRARDAE